MTCFLSEFPGACGLGSVVGLTLNKEEHSKENKTEIQHIVLHIYYSGAYLFPEKRCSGLIAFHCICLVKTVKQQKNPATMCNWHEINFGNKHRHLLTSHYLTCFHVSVMAVLCHLAWWNHFWSTFYSLSRFWSLWEFSFSCLVLCTSCRTFKSQCETVMSPEAWNIKNHTDFSSKSNHTHHRNWGREKKERHKLASCFSFFFLSLCTSTNKKVIKVSGLSKVRDHKDVQSRTDEIDGQSPFSRSVRTNYTSYDLRPACTFKI